MRLFWPVFCVAAIGGGAAVWILAPRVRPYLSEGTRATMIEQTRRLQRLLTPASSSSSSSASAERPSGKAVVTPVAAAAVPPPARPASNPVEAARAAVAATPRADDELAVPPAPRPAAAPARPAEPINTLPVAAAEEEEEDMPSLRGVMQSDAAHAAWGVVNAVTPVKGLDGTDLGVVDGGAFFVIENRRREGSSLKLVGNFTPKRMEEEFVAIDAEALYCFTGGPDKLSPRQRDALKNYYRLRGEAEALKAKLLKANGAKSPFFAPASAALQEFRAKAAEAEALEGKLVECKPAEQYAIQSALSKLKNDLSVIRIRLQKLNDQHKAWKTAHAAQLPDPEKDPEYLALVAKRAPFAKRIPGMAY